MIVVSVGIASEPEILLPEGAIARLVEGWINDVAFSPDGQYLALGTGSGVELRDAVSLELVRFFHDHTIRVISVAFSPDGSTLASCSGVLSDLTIKLWDVDRGEVRDMLTGHTWKVYSVAFSLDGRKLASSSADETVRLWNVETGKELSILIGHTMTVYSVVFSPDGKDVGLRLLGQHDQAVGRRERGDSLHPHRAY